MKTFCLLLCVLLAGLPHLSGEELLKSVDFSKGKGGWQGPGTVIHLSPDGKEHTLASAETTSVLRVKLSKNRWSVLEYRVRLGREHSAASVALEVQTSPDFAPLAESKEYAEEDFREGGEYGWSARIFPKARLLIQLSEEGGWQYRPKALQAASGWQTLTANFDKLKSKQNEVLAICLPPGEGFVDLKKISLEAR